MLINHESGKVVSQLLAHIDSKIWQQVAVNRVSQMTPINVRLMNQYTFQSLAELNSTHLQKADAIEQKEIGPCNPKEALIQSSIPIILKSNTAYGLPNSSAIMNATKMSKFGQRKSSRVSSKLELPRTKTNKSLGAIFKYVSLDAKDGSTKDTLEEVQQQKTIEQNIDRQRQKKIFIEQKEREEQIILSQQMEENKIKEARLRKKLKEIHRLSYDYSGDFFNANGSVINSTLGGAAIMKSTINHERLPTMAENKKAINSIRLKTISTLIENQRILERKQKIQAGRVLTESMEPYFKESTAARFSNSFNDEECLSEGCRVEQKTSHFSREKTLNRSGIKITLEQFKKQTASRKYKQFRLKTSKKLKDNKLKMQLNNQQKEQNDLQPDNIDCLGDGKRRLKSMVGSEKSQILTSSILTQQGSRSKGNIKVSNHSLYQSVFSQD